jgi:hypothetical protein
MGAYADHGLSILIILIGSVLGFFLIWGAAAAVWWAIDKISRETARAEAAKRTKR